MVYIDSTRTSWGRGKWCHMVADTHEELMAFAKLIGCKPAWLQDAGTYREHFDLPKFRRARAVKEGAREVTMSELGRILRSKKLSS